MSLDWKKLEKRIEFFYPDLAFFMVLTPFPETELYEQAKSNGWIEDWNRSNYDTIHAIMPSETLSKQQVQHELYNCCRSFFSSWRRYFQSIFSTNQINGEVYRHIAHRNVPKQLKSLVRTDSLMSSHNNTLDKIPLLFMVSISFLGLIFVMLLAIYPPTSREDFVWRKFLIGSTYSVVCVLGILAVLFPYSCSNLFSVDKREQHQKREVLTYDSMFSHDDALALRGHHPTCGYFSSHVFRLSGRTFCATCSGLLLGAIIALAGIALCFSGNWQLGQNAFVAVFFGIVGVMAGVLQSFLHIFQSSVIRLFTSISFVLGTFLILVGLEELAHNTSADLFVISLSIFWITTRISLSKRDHNIICSKCALNSCGFAER